MQTLFIITQVEKPNPFNANGKAFSLIQGDQQMYATYPEAEAKIPKLGKGIFQIQKVFVNEK